MSINLHDSPSGGSHRTAMRQALLELGHEHVYHMTDNYKNPRDLDMWKEALDWKFHGKGKPFTRKDWDQLLGHCDVKAQSLLTTFTTSQCGRTMLTLSLGNDRYPHSGIHARVDRSIPRGKSHHLHARSLCMAQVRHQLHRRCLK